MNRQAPSPVLGSGLYGWVEKDRFPDWLLRLGIRRIVARRLREQSAGGQEQRTARFREFVNQLHRMPVAIRPEAANRQHYEVPAAFFRIVLGPRMKYSCALWEDGCATLEKAEEAMLEMTCRRAGLEAGQEILDLGCGWGSLALFAAERYPGSHVVAVSNSRSQKRHIDEESSRRGLKNLEVVTADINDFDTGRRFDRVVSVEMFEHLRNYGELFRRIHRWTRPGALVFVHVFAHRCFAYPFTVRDASDWMAQHFFTGGLMPSDDLLLQFPEHFQAAGHWRLPGGHYRKTAEAWLRRLDSRRRDVLDLFKQTYGERDALRWLVRWRLFFLACSEMFGYRRGSEWIVCHYRFERRERATDQPASRAAGY